MFWNKLFANKQGEETLAKMAKDPICGMEVSTMHAYATQLGERTYYFCGAACKAAFKKSRNKELDVRPIKTRKSHGNGGCCH